MRFRRRRSTKSTTVTVDGFPFATAGESARYLALKARASQIEYLGAGSGLLVFKYRFATAESWTNESFKGVAPKPSKYRNRKVTVDGIKFDSKLEAWQYKRLQPRVKSGELIEMRRQHPWPLIVNGKLVCTFKSDFDFVIAATGEHVVQDAKGYQTRESITKHKLYRAVYGVAIEVIRR